MWKRNREINKNRKRERERERKEVRKERQERREIEIKRQRLKKWKRMEEGGKERGFEGGKKERDFLMFPLSCFTTELLL